MMKTWKLLTVAALVLTGAVFAADPAASAEGDAVTYTIKLKSSPDVGKSVVVRYTEKQSSLTRGLDINGKPLPEVKTEETKEDIYTETILLGGDPLAQKYKRVYEKAVTKAGDKTSKKSYQGRTILFELKKNKYEVTVEGDPPLAADDLKTLSDLAIVAEGPDMMPKKAVKIGESWTIDIKEFARLGCKDSTVDEKKSNITRKLVKVTDRDGQKIGVIETKMHMVFTGANGTRFELPSVNDTEETMEMAIDGSSFASKIRSTSTSKSTLNNAAGAMEFITKVTAELEYSAEK